MNEISEGTGKDHVVYYGKRNERQTIRPWWSEDEHNVVNEKSGVNEKRENENSDWFFDRVNRFYCTIKYQLVNRDISITNKIVSISCYYSYCNVLIHDVSIRKVEQELRKTQFWINSYILYFLESCSLSFILSSGVAYEYTLAGTSKIILKRDFKRYDCTNKETKKSQNWKSDSSKRM